MGNILFKSIFCVCLTLSKWSVKTPIIPSYFNYILKSFFYPWISDTLKIFQWEFKMTFLTSWEDFEMAAERLYLQNPLKV